MKKERKLAWVQLISLLVIAACTGAIGGMAYERWNRIAHREPIEIGDFSEMITLLHFDSIENGVLHGKLEGEEARIIIAGAKGEVVSVFPGEFEIPLTEIMPMLKQVPAPQGMGFVASKNGKYFYPLDSPRAALITPKNRVFFTDRATARKAGFVDG